MNNSVFGPFIRGVGRLLAGMAAVGAFFKDWRETIKFLQELPLQDAVTLFWAWWNSIPFENIVVWVLAVSLVSLLGWLLYSGPKKRMDIGFYEQLEKRHPGATKHKRKRKPK